MRELLLFVIGAAAGVISGMGMGGGTLLIPALTLLMGIPQRQAQGVNMLSFLPAAAVALYIHKKEGRLELKSSTQFASVSTTARALIWRLSCTVSPTMLTMPTGPVTASSARIWRRNSMPRLSMVETTQYFTS